MRIAMSLIVLFAFIAAAFNFGFPTAGSVASAASASSLKLDEGTTTAKEIKSTITVDGSLGEKDWVMDTPIEYSVLGESNNKASYGLLWDSKYLYVGVKVTDSKLVKDSVAPEDDDCVEIYLDTNNNHFSKYDIFDSYYKIRYNDPEIWELYNKINGVKFASKAFQGGYSVEVAFPWSTILATPKQGKMFGIDVGVADDDNGGKLDSLMMWCGGADNATNAQNFGDFYLNNSQDTLKCPAHPSTKLSTVYHFNNFFEYVYPQDPTRILRMWIPDNSKTVKGLIILGNGGTGDWRYESALEDVQLLAKRYGFGVASTAGISGGQVYNENGRVLLGALDEFAKIDGHTELKNVPLIYSGSSSGGAAAYGMTNLVPDRMICFSSNVTGGFNPQTPTDEAMKVPGMFSTGQWDPSFNGQRNAMLTARSKGGLWSWVAIEGMGHEHRRTYHMFFPFWEACIKARYPANADPKKGPVKLNPIKESSGWLADNTSWETGCTDIASYSDYKGDKSEASWIINKDIAYLYRGLSSWNKKMIFTMENNPAPATDREFTMKVMHKGDKIVLANDAAKFVAIGTKNFEWYMGSELLGTTTEPYFEYTLTDKCAAQTFTAIGYDGSGNPHASDIVGVVVG